MIDNEGGEEVNAPALLEDRQKQGVNYAMHLPDMESVTVNPSREWNNSEIIFDNGHVEHWPNGKKIVEFETWTDDWFARRDSGKWTNAPKYGLALRGLLCLQDYSDRTTISAIRAGKSL